MNRVVLYGGSPGGPVDFYSTWLFDGVAWTEYNTTAEPVNPQATYGQFVYDAAANQVIDLNEPIALGPVSTWALNISNAAIGPSPLSVTLTATPSSITLGGETNLSAVPSGGTPPIRYVYTNLPAGCVSANVPTLACTPTATGSFRVTVTVTDDLGNTAEANASLTVSAGTTSPPASSSGSSSYWIWAVLAVVIIAVLLAIVLFARRRRPPPTPYTPGGPPVPPPTPPPPPGN